MTCLYRLKNSEGRLLYVGITGNFDARLSQHRREKSWSNEIAAWELEYYATRREAEDAEQKAIKSEHPLHNVVHSRRTSSTGGKEYTREQAAKILGVSPRRISQMADEGKFVIEQLKPLRLSAESVHAMREHRRSRSADIRSTVPPADQPDALMQVLTILREQLAQSAEHLADARAERDLARAEIARLHGVVESARVWSEHQRKAAAVIRGDMP